MYPFKIIAFLLVPSLAMAQALNESGTALADADDNVQDTEVVTLDEFKVSTTSLKDVYVASESASGMRIKEKVVDLPYSVQVFTEVLINDFQLFDNEDIFAFTAGATTNTGLSNTIRGFPANSSRDGFRYTLDATASNTARRDIIRGPQSTLYGQANPGGFINSMTKRPSAKPSYSFTVSPGSHDFLRLGAYATGSLIPNKLYYQVAYDYTDRRSAFDTNDSDYRKQLLSLAFLYKFNRQTSLMLTLEYQPTEGHEVASGPTYYTGGTLTTGGFGVSGTDPQRTANWNGFAHLNQLGPNSHYDRDYYGVNLLFEHRIRKWTTRLALQTWTKDNYKYQDMRTGFYEKTQRFGETLFQIYDERDDNIALQGDLYTQWHSGSVKHKIFIAADASFRNTDLKQKDMPEMDRSRLSTEIRFLDPLNPVWGRYGKATPGSTDIIDHDLVDRLSANRVIDETSLGVLLSHRAAFFKNERLYTMLSGRVDYIDLELDNRPDLNANPTIDPLSGERVYTPGPRTRGSLDKGAFSYGAGVNYKILGDDRLVAYGLASSAFTPNRSADTVTNKLLDPQEAYSFEIGLKGVFPEKTLGFHQISYTFGLYQLTRDKVATANPAYTGVIATSPPQYLLNRKDRATGGDITVYLTPVKDLTFILGLAYIDAEILRDVDSEYTAQGQRIQPDNKGKPMPNVSKWTANFMVRYKFPKGIFNGLSSGFGVNYRSDFIGYLETSTTYEKKMPSLTQATCFLTYVLRTKKPLNAAHSFSLNVFNLFDKKYYGGNGRISYGTEARFSYTLKF